MSFGWSAGEDGFSDPLQKGTIKKHGTSNSVVQVYLLLTPLNPFNSIIRSIQSKTQAKVPAHSDGSFAQSVAPPTYMYLSFYTSKKHLPTEYANTM
jgi:hypothetical protein